LDLKLGFAKSHSPEASAAREEHDQRHPDSTDDSAKRDEWPNNCRGKRRAFVTTQLHSENKMVQNGIEVYEMDLKFAKVVPAPRGSARRA
jgi:hypothetical protein